MTVQSQRAERRLRLFLMAGGGALAMATPAFAQTAESSSSNTVEAIIVTAQKREENLQDVPISVTALTAATIERLHVQDMKDLTAAVPNVQVQVNAGVALAASYVIRGIGIANNPTPYVGTEVGTVVDGVVMSTNSVGLADQFDVERIEVLRGPQGTLFGANTTGGVINIITKQPTGEFGAYGTLTAGNYRRLDTAVGVNFPIIEGVLAGKIAVSHRGREGFYTNLFNNEHIGGINSTLVRGYLLWTPNEDVDATLVHEDQNIRNGSDILHPLSYPGQVFYRAGTPLDKFVIYSDVPDSTKAHIASTTLTTNWASDFGKITAIANYRKYIRKANQDLDGVNCFCFAQANREWGEQQSLEVRDVFHPMEGVEVLLGGFAQIWTYKALGLTETTFVAPGSLGLGIGQERTTNLAGFGEVYWQLTERLRLQGGLRVSNERVRIYRANVSYNRPAGNVSWLGFGNLTGAIQLPLSVTNAPSGGEESWTNLGGKVGADYKLTEDVMAYGYYARGFKSGGFNGRVSRSEDIGPYDPEYVDSFETGIKSDLLDNRLRLNVSLFLNKWKDMQVARTVYHGTPPVGSAVILNAGKATSKGIEFDGEFVPVDGLRLNASFGYLSAEYDDFRSGTGPACPALPAPQPVGCSAVYTGRDLPYSPKWNGSLSASYIFDMAGGSTNATLQYTYNGARWGNFTQSRVERLGAVGLVNGNISWKPEGAQWSVALWGRNILDKRYVAMSLDVPPLFTEGVLGNPRQFGVDFNFDF